MLRLVIAVLLSLLASMDVRADPVDPVPPFIKDLQAAIGKDDKQWLADHLHLPVSYYGNKHQVIRNKHWFIAHYAALISPELKRNVLAQDPDNYFKNYQGVMVGDGGLNIWLNDFGDEGAGLPARFEIITINNTPLDSKPNVRPRKERN